MTKHVSLYEAAARAADKLDATPGGKKAANDVRRLVASHRSLHTTASQQAAEIERLRAGSRKRMLNALDAIRAKIDRIENDE